MIATQPYTAQGAAPSAPALSVLPVGHSPVLWAERPEADRLAIAYQRGETWALEPLYENVRPIIAFELGVARSRARSLGLPLPLEHADLQQQAWVALAHLATLWRPDLGAFGAYVRAALPWMLAGYTRQQSHARRSARVQVLSVPHELAAEWAGRTADADGRLWADSLAIAELLTALAPRERAVLLLVGIQRYRVADVARRLGISAVAASAALRRARSAMREGLAATDAAAPAF